MPPTPDAATLLSVMRQWSDPAVQQRVLVDNPALLYG
jgi:predicted TIM-barrel fold metal-dependent hydrolase